MNIKEQKTQIFIAIAVILIFFIIGIFVATKFYKRTGKRVEKVEKSKKVFKEEIGYTLFYPSTQKEFLLPVVKRVEKHDFEEENIVELLKTLVKGDNLPSNVFSPFKENTKIIDVFIVKDGLAVLNFSRELLENDFPGSETEIFVVYSIVNSVCYNFPDIKKVQILVDGREIETLYGHLDLRFPVKFNAKWIKSN